MNTPQDNAHTFIAYFAKKSSGLFLIQAILCLAWSVKEALFPYFIKLLLDDIHHENLPDTHILTPLLYLMVIWVVMEIAMRLQGYFSVRTFPKFRAQIRAYCFQQLQSQSYAWLSARSNTVINEPILQLPKACQTVLETILLHFVSIFSAILLSLILLSSVSYLFGALLSSWLVLHFILVRFNTSDIMTSGLAHAQSEVDVNARLGDIFRNILPVKWFAREVDETEQYEQLQEKEINKAAIALKSIEYLRIAQSLLAIVYMSLMFASLGYYWHQHWIRLGDLALVPMLSFSALGMIWWLTQELNTYYRALNSINWCLDFLRQTRKPAKTQLTDKIELPHHDIQLENISFSYQDKTVLSHLNLVIPTGDKVAIMGLSGAGKSTLLSLLTGIYEPRHGQIKIGGHDILSLPIWLRSQLIAVVPQDPCLFNRTILENIRYGDLNATDNAVIQSAKLALCDDFIQTLPDGYHTVVGDNGARLSLGQRQRILIARALLVNAPIIIMDEPTASLDRMTENDLLNILEHTLSACTVVLITHRENTLKLVNRTVIIENGTIKSSAAQYNLMMEPSE